MYVTHFRSEYLGAILSSIALSNMTGINVAQGVKCSTGASNQEER